MRTWKVIYKNEEFKIDVAEVKATTYTKALVEFMVKYPNCEYMRVKEVFSNESKS